MATIKIKNEILFIDEKGLYFLLACKVCSQTFTVPCTEVKVYFIFKHIASI